MAPANKRIRDRNQVKHYLRISSKQEIREMIPPVPPVQAKKVTEMPKKA
jgi:hypothetical protein